MFLETRSRASLKILRLDSIKSRGYVSNILIRALGKNIRPSDAGVRITRWKN